MIPLVDGRAFAKQESHHLHMTFHAGPHQGRRAQVPLFDVKQARVVLQQPLHLTQVAQGGGLPYRDIVHGA
jgi:hypothetical protein